MGAISLIVFFISNHKQCSDAYIYEQVEQIRENIDSSKDGAKTLREIDKHIKDRNIALHQRETVIYNQLEIAIRRRNSCDIPDHLNVEITNYLTSNNDTGVRCTPDQFDDEAKAQYNEYKEYSNFSEVEENIRASFYKQLRAAETKETFNEKWNNASFREMLLTVSLNVKLRKNENCQNAVLPVTSLMRELQN